MNEEEKKKYYQAYYDNEADANKQMSFANAFAAFVMLVIWICYLTNLFIVTANAKIGINIIFPISILILLTPLLYTFKFPQALKKPTYKYFVVFSFIFVMATLNIIIPKHALLGWALSIVITTHYYNQKLCRITFVIVLALMIICLYAGMFVGEYDPHLIGNGAIVDNEIVYIDGVKERYAYLTDLLLKGENRYLKVFTYYYLPRSAMLALIFLVSNSLNKRTYNLLISEININSEQEKTKTELEVARDIQLATLSNDFVTSENIEVVAEIKPVKEVGGDFYDCVKIDDNHTAIVIGDVSGKGIAAAMFMMKTITCFKNYARNKKKPSQILKEINKSIYENNTSQMFVTCFIAILDETTGEVVFANAGHNHPIIGNNRHYRYLPCKSGFILGVMEEAMCEDEVITLKPGESITLYTDGITEAKNEKGELFSETRLLQIFNKFNYTCIVELHHTLKDMLDAYVGEAPQSDDITFITMKYHGDKYSYSEHNFEAYLDNIPEALKFIETFCEDHKLPKDFKNNLLVVGDELISNIVKYGYQNKGGDIFIRLLYNVDKKEFALTVIDVAPAFNQLEVNNSKVEGEAEDQKVGGLGILIVKQIMSTYLYDRINNKNILVLRKKF